MLGVAPNLRFVDGETRPLLTQELTCEESTANDIPRYGASLNQRRRFDTFGLVHLAGLLSRESYYHGLASRSQSFTISLYVRSCRHQL